MIARPLDRVGRCVCGLGVALHFDDQNRKLTCDETRAWLERCATGDRRADRAHTPTRPTEGVPAC